MSSTRSEDNTGNVDTMPRIPEFDEAVDRTVVERSATSEEALTEGIDEVARRLSD